MLAPLFFFAGLAAAAGVLVIHFLNRRRYKVVYWAAMDFLREAIFRNRRLLQLRDLLLLGLRMACLILFGLALARPGCRSVGRPDSNMPVHAVVLVDNSLSMGYRPFMEQDKILLDEAKDKAKELINGLPRGSRISVLPTCGTPAGFSYEAYYGKDDALESLEQIEPVDRATTARETIDLALEACNRVRDMPAKQIFLITDQQVAAWPAESLGDHLKQLPNPMKVVEVAQKELENAWVSDVKLRDGVADLQTPAIFIATIEYEGSLPRLNVPVTLSVDGVNVATKTVNLQAGQKREVEFPPYQFDVTTESGQPTFVLAEVSIPQDKLPADDQRFAVVPVVATLPVVFVDQWGKDEEDPRTNCYGETYHLRRLMAPLTAGAERSRQPVEIRHVKIDELEGATGRELLEDARLVVVAGVPDPGGSVALLREYVEQGGNLMIAAGAFFDPDDWNAAAWKDGLGILPAPLSGLAGRLPEEVGVLEPFQLDYNSLQNHEYFLLEGTSREQQQDLYQLPYFFKAVRADVSDEVKETMVAAVAKEIEQHRADVAGIDQQLAELDKKDNRRKLTPEELNRRTTLRRQRQELEPSWLLWSPPGAEEDGKRPIEYLADRTRPSVLARYTNGLPFMIERRQGRGRVLFVSTGVGRFPEWNTFTFTDTMLLYDRILRGVLESTLPERNLSSERQIELPVAASQRSATFTLTDPDGREESLTVNAVGGDRWGITLGDLMQRGHYQVAAARTRNLPQDEESPDKSLETKLWVVSLAVNGPAEESRLISAEEARRRQDRGLAEVQASAAAGIQFARLRGAGLWRWLMLAVLACLLTEMAFLVWPSLGREETE